MAFNCIFEDDSVGIEDKSDSVLNIKTEAEIDVPYDGKQKRSTTKEGSQVSGRDVFSDHEEVIQPLASSEGQTIEEATSNPQCPNNNTVDNVTNEMIKTEIKQEPVDQEEGNLRMTNISEGCINKKDVSNLIERNREDATAGKTCHDPNDNVFMPQFLCVPCRQYFCTVSVLSVHSRFHQRLQICSCNICDMPYSPDVDSENSQKDIGNPKEVIKTFYEVLKLNQKLNPIAYEEESNIQNIHAQELNICIPHVDNNVQKSYGEGLNVRNVPSLNVQKTHTKDPMANVWSTQMNHNFQSPYVQESNIQSTQEINVWSPDINSNIQSPYMDGSITQITNTQGSNIWGTDMNEHGQTFYPNGSNGQNTRNIFNTHMNQNVQNPYVEGPMAQSRHTQVTNVWSTHMEQKVQNPYVNDPNILRTYTGGLNIQSTQMTAQNEGLNVYNTQMSDLYGQRSIQNNGCLNTQEDQMGNATMKQSHIPVAYVGKAYKTIKDLREPYVDSSHIQMIDKLKVQHIRTHENNVHKPRAEVTNTQEIQIGNSFIKKVGHCIKKITTDETVLTGKRIEQLYVAGTNIQKTQINELNVVNMQLSDQNIPYVKENNLQVVKVGNSTVRRVNVTNIRRNTADENENTAKKISHQNIIQKPNVEGHNAQLVRIRNSSIKIQKMTKISSTTNSEVEKNVPGQNILNVEGSNIQKTPTKKLNFQATNISAQGTQTGQIIKRAESISGKFQKTPTDRGASMGQQTVKSPCVAKELSDLFPVYNPYNCDVCGKQFTNQRHLARHYQTHYPDKYICDKCNKEYTSRPGLNRHRDNFCKKSGVDHRMSCDKCQKPFSNKVTLYVHQRYHCFVKTGDMPFACQHCKRKFPEKHLLTHHARVNHSKSYKCKICNKIIGSSSNFRRHLQTHSALKMGLVFQCSWCPKSFSKKDSLKYHIARHKGIKKYACKVCGKAFADPKHRCRHESNVCSETAVRKKPYVCDVCKNRYATKSIIRQHLLTYHTASYICDLCNKSFGQKNYLKTHLHFHIGIFPTCDVCKKWFVKKKTLIKHLKTHE